MTILNFTGFETGTGVELLEILGTPTISNISDSQDVHSGNYSMTASSSHGSGYGGFTMGEIYQGRHIVMDRNRIFVRFYCYFKKLPANSTEFFAIKDKNNYIKISLRVDSSGNLIVMGYSTTTSSAGTLFTTYDAIFTQEIWYRIEISFVSNGQTEIKINGTSLGIISLISNNIYISRIMLGNSDDYDVHDTDYEFSIDDVQIRNDSFPGNGNTTSLEPISFGHYFQWNGQLEDILNPVDDLALKALDGRITSFKFYVKDETYLGSINAIKPIAFCYCPSSKICGVKNLLIINSTNYFDTNFVYIPPLSYYPTTNIYEKNSSTNNPWTRTDLKNLEYGILSSDDTTEARCDYIALQIDYS